MASLNHMILLWSKVTTNEITLKNSECNLLIKSLLSRIVEDFLINVDSDSDNELSEVEQEDSESGTNVYSENQNSDSE